MTQKLDETFQFVFRQSYDSVLEINLETGSYLQTVLGQEKLCGLSLEGDYASAFFKELENRLCSDEVDCVRAKLSIDALRQACAQGKKESCCEFRFCGLERAAIWLECRILFITAQGECRAFVLVRDITEKKQQEFEKSVKEQYAAALKEIYDELYELNVTKNSYHIVHHVKGKYVSPPEEGNLQETIGLVAENMIFPEDRERFLELFDLSSTRRTFAAGKTSRIAEFRKLCEDGRFHWASFTLFPVKMTPNGDEVYLCFIMDVDDKKKSDEIEEQNRALKKQKRDDERYRIIVEQTHTIVFEWNRNGDQYISPLFSEQFTGRYEGRDVLTVWEEDKVIHPDDLEEFSKFRLRIHNGQQYSETMLRLKSHLRGFIWCKVAITCLRDEDGSPERVIGTLNDADEAVKMEKSLKRRAELDMLTGMYNKVTAQTLVAAYLQENLNKMNALFLIDIDDFKSVNDNLGHLFGDAVLTEISARVRGLFREEDIIGRIGGDEFLVFLKDVPSEEIIERKANVLSEIFHHSFSGEKRDFKISGSVGIAVSPRDGVTYPELFHKADQALYFAKQEGKDRYKIYMEKMEDDCLGKVCENHTNRIESTGSGQDFTSYVFDILYGAADIEKAISRILNLTARYYNVSHVYFYYETQPGGIWGKKFEWCQDPSYAFTDEGLFSMKNSPEYQAPYDENGIFHCTDISTLAPRLSRMLSQMGVHSVLQSAIVEDGVCKGCIGFVEHVATHVWTQEEVDASIFISRIVMMFLLRGNIKEKITKEQKIKLELLEKIHTWIYVLDRNYHLLYANRRAVEENGMLALGRPYCQQLSLEAVPGFRHPLCEAANQEDPYTEEIYDQKTGRWLEIKVEKTKWADGCDAFLMTGHDTSKYHN